MTNRFITEEQFIKDINKLIDDLRFKLIMLEAKRQKYQKCKEIGRTLEFFYDSDRCGVCGREETEPEVIVVN